MSRITVDNELRSKLNGLDQHIELCDESGQTMGHFLPEKAYREMIEAWVETVFTKEELRRMDQETGGRPLSETWKRLGRA
jgi:hypothetical protein